MYNQVRRPYTVAELIEHLQALPQDAPVVCATDKDVNFVRTMIVEPFISTLGRDRVVMITGCFKPDIFPLDLTIDNYLTYLGQRLTNRICEYLATGTSDLTLEIIAQINIDEFSKVRNVGKILIKQFEQAQEELKEVLSKINKY